MKLFRGFVTAAITSWLILGGTAHAADISFVDMFRNNSNQQTGDGNSLSSNGSFLSLELTSVNPNDYSSVTATYPGPASPLSIPMVSPTLFHFQTPFLPDQATMDTQFPTGSYTFTTNNGDSTVLNYSQDYFATSNPYLTGNDFSDLQDMDATKSFTFTLSPFTAPALPAGSLQFIFLTVFDFTKNMFVFSDGFLPPDTTSVVLPANTLTPGDTFSYEVDFSDRVFDPQASSAVFPAELGFDVRTDGTFTAAPVATPEPATVTLLGLGLACVAARSRQRRGRKS